jgi:hypothetical protein
MRTLTIRFIIIISILILFLGAYYFFQGYSRCPAYPGVFESCTAKMKILSGFIFFFGIFGLFFGMAELKKTVPKGRPD